MAFDFKKEYKEFYLPKRTPELVSVPPMTFVAVRGEGDPNVEGGAYKEAVGVLYAIAYTIKMSKMGDHRIDGYYDFVVPRWRASGGSRAWKASTSRIRRRFTGLPPSACPTS